MSGSRTNPILDIERLRVTTMASATATVMA